VTPARARLLRRTLGAAAIVLVCIGFFVRGMHEWVRVTMFIAIVGIAAWGNDAQAQASVREQAPQPLLDDVAPMAADLPAPHEAAD
jgi:hypothetical protein